MKLMMIFILAVILGAFEATANIEVDFDIHPRIIRINETATARLVISGIDNPPRPSFSRVEGLRIVGEGQSQQVQVVNNQISRSTEYTYTVTPLETGEHRIGPFTYRVDGQDIDVPAAVLEVVEAGEGRQRDRSEQSLSDMLFARINVPETTLYSQQRFDFILEVYAHERLNLTGNFEPHGLPQSRLNLGRFRSMGQDRRLVDGQMFTVYRFVANARAVEPGSFSVQMGMRAGVNVQERSQDRSTGAFGDPFFDSFFSRRRVENVDVHVYPLELTILPLPSDGRPGSFSGAVGEFDFQIDLSPSELQVGDPITMTMTVEGRGNIDSITAPEIDIPDGFRVYDTRLTESVEDQASTRARKIYESVLIPRTEEIDEIPEVEFSYFNPELGEYVVARRGPFTLMISPADEAPAPAIVANQRQPIDELLGEDIAYLKDINLEQTPARMFAVAESPVFWGVQSIPLIAIASLLIYKRRHDKLRGNIALARRTRAPRVARKALREAEAAAAADDRHEFFDALWRSGADYFGNRLNLAPGEVDRDQIIEFCRDTRLNSQTLEALCELLQTCEMERFTASAQSLSGVDHRQVLNKMRATLKACERDRSTKGATTTAPLFLMVLLAGLATAAIAVANNQISAEELIATARQAYGEEDFEAARRHYSKLIDRGYRTAAVHYNLGNSYYRLGDIGNAVLNYRRAWYMTPGDHDINANLALALRRSGLELPPQPLHARIFGRVGANAWVAFAVAMYWLTFALAVLWLLSGRHRRLMGRIVGASAIILFACLAGVASWRMVDGASEAVVIVDGHEASFAPAEGATAHFSIPVGSIVRVTDSTRGWLRVSANGRSGWVPGEICSMVNP